MSISYEDRLALGLVSDGNESWGPILRQNFEVLAELACPDNMYFVSPHFTDEFLHNAGATAPRFFATLQAAHDAITSGTGYTKRAVVKVYPGDYYENLTITKTALFMSAVPAYSDGLGAFRPVRLLGAGGVQSPLLTINPPNDTELAVGFSNFVFENGYNTTAGAIVKAQVAKVNPQTTYGVYQNKLAFLDCDIRMQTYGNGNEWWAGIWADGWADVRLRRCNVFAGSHGGGANNAGIANLFLLTGNTANAKKATIRVDQQTAIAHFYKGTIFVSPTIFNLNHGANGVVSRTAALLSMATDYVQGTYSILGGSGTNVLDGFTSPATYGNLLGVNLTGL